VRRWLKAHGDFRHLPRHAFARTEIKGNANPPSIIN
jgi:hypothetical protein